MLILLLLMRVRPQLGGAGQACLDFRILQITLATETPAIVARTQTASSFDTTPTTASASLASGMASHPCQNKSAAPLGPLAGTGMVHTLCGAG
jgi:hypothetical protein